MEPGHIEFVHRSWPADPAQLAVIRHELTDWLTPLRLTDDETADVVLAVDEAAANAAHNGVTNAAFECATAAHALAGERGRSLLAGVDAVILDPPRKGCEEGVLAPLATSAVPTILYVSCNPATLARDAAILASSGYALRSVEPFDMFPRTGHVEALAEFERAAPH